MLRNSQLLRNLALAIGVTTALAGCGGGNDAPPLYPVTGIVKYQGGPLAGARIAFIPDGKGAVAMATSDSQGRYTMKTGVDAGVAAGICKVTVSLSDGSAAEGGGLSKTMSPEDMQKMAMSGELDKALKGQEKSNMLPAKYSKADSTPLNFEVKAGNNDIPLDLTD